MCIEYDRTSIETCLNPLNAFFVRGVGVGVGVEVTSILE